MKKARKLNFDVIIINVYVMHNSSGIDINSISSSINAVNLYLGQVEICQDSNMILTHAS